MRKVSKNILLSILTICFSFNAFNTFIFCAAGGENNIMDLKFEGDPVLRAKSKEVKNFDEKLAKLIDDMKATMYKEGGVGLAAPQVGISKRIVVIDVSEDKSKFIELVNPVITYKSEEKQKGYEGCLSIPDVMGIVERPSKVTVVAKDRNQQEIKITGEGLLARAICHEVDHLDGILYRDIAEKMLTKEEIQKIIEEQKLKQEQEQKQKLQEETK